MRHSLNITALFLLLLVLPVVHADVPMGSLNFETILDNAQNYGLPTVTKENTQTQGSFITQSINYVGDISSTVLDDFAAQFQNKEQGLNQNKELDVAKKNLANSKENVTNMFLFIVGTLVVLTDAIVSVTYILLVMLAIWIVFVGYAKVLILVIDFISGRLEERGMRRT